MITYFVILHFLQLFYFTSSADTQNSNAFFRRDYRFYETTQSFYQLHQTHRTWHDAKKRCAMEGAFLWYPEDQEEVNLMVDYWKEKKSSELMLFVGISDLLSEGNYITVDGKPIEEIWSNWGPGEPNNAPYHGGEHCATLRRDWQKPGNLDLNDENCDEPRKPFICKKTLLTLKWNAPCDMPDQRYFYEGSTGKCYRIELKPTEWTEAFSVCMAEQSYLAVINNEKERNVLVNVTSKAGIQNNPGDLKYVHLGFHNRFGDGWQTVTGAQIENDWNMWERGQPTGGGNKSCGAMTLNGLYKELRCDEKAYFICEHDISSLGSMIRESPAKTMK